MGIEGKVFSSCHFPIPATVVEQAISSRKEGTRSSTTWAPERRIEVGVCNGKGKGLGTVAHGLLNTTSQPSGRYTWVHLRFFSGKSLQVTMLLLAGIS